MTAPASFPGARMLRSFEYWAYQYKRTWRGSVVSSVLTPALFLAAMGVGLGSLVNSGGRLSGDYLQFLAPGLLAATAMQIGYGESTYPVLGSIKWIRTYHGMLATPLGVGDVLGGHLLWVAFRVASTSAIYLVVMTLFGASASWWALATVPAATLCGLAFATPTFAAIAATENEEIISALQRFVIVPLFLFSGSFFPVTQLPTGLEQFAYVTPTWHAVALCRSLALGTQTIAGSVLHVGYLLVWIGVGLLAARRAFVYRLVRLT